MVSKKLVATLLGVAVLSGCSALPLFSGAGPQYDVSVETVTVNDSQTRVIAITPPGDRTLPKGAEITVDGGYVTFTESPTMNYSRTVYLTYVPSRTKFELTARLDGEIRSLDDANFTVSAVRISARGDAESYEL